MLHVPIIHFGIRLNSIQFLVDNIEIDMHIHRNAFKNRLHDIHCKYCMYSIIRLNTTFENKLYRNAYR